MNSLRARWIAAAMAACALSLVRLAAQTVTFTVTGETTHVRAPGFHFIKGEPLDRLKDGRSVGFDLVMTATSRPGTDTLSESRRSFVLSYDLWEERFAVTETGANGRSVSHLTANDAEAWCLDRLTLSTSALRGKRSDDRFWIRIAYRSVPEEDRTTGDGRFTLRGLIDRLSRREAADQARDALDAGPFRLPTQ